MPETFSSDIGDVHERSSDQPSFNSEFKGASDSLLDRRPPRPLDAGRRGRRLMLAIVLITAALGGGGWALWYWSEPIGEWMAGWGEADDPEPAAAVDDPVVEEPVVEQPPSEPPREFGIKGAPDAPDSGETPPPGNSEAVPETPPGNSEVAPETPPGNSEVVPNPASASVEIKATNVRGKVASSTVSSRLASVDASLKTCWTTAAAKPETKRPAEVTLRFSIKWNGRLISITVIGDAPESVRSCIRSALPSSGWPQPRDGGEAQITRSWMLR